MALRNSVLVGGVVLGSVESSRVIAGRKYAQAWDSGMVPRICSSGLFPTRKLLLGSFHRFKPEFHVAVPGLAYCKLEDPKVNCRQHALRPMCLMQVSFKEVGDVC